MTEITNDKASQFYNIALKQLKAIWEQPSYKFSGVEPKSADELVFYLGCIFGCAKKTYDEFKALAKIVVTNPEFPQIATQIYQELFAYITPGDERVGEVMHFVEKVQAVIMGELDAEYGFEINKIFMPLGFTPAMIDACLEEDKSRFEAELGAFKTIETLNQSSLQAIAVITMIESHVNCKVSERMAGVSECDLSEIPEETLPLEYKRNILMYRSVKELVEKMPDESSAWKAYFSNHNLTAEASYELDPIVRTLLTITNVSTKWKYQLYSFFRELSPYGTMPSPKRQRLYELLNNYPDLISQEYKAYCSENNVGDPLSELFNHAERDSEPSTNHGDTIDILNYKGLFVSKRPDVTAEQMRKIAWRLAGKDFDGLRTTDSGFYFINAEDVNRLCYFFIGQAKIKDEDFNRPVNWLRNWNSYWYFVKQLYGNKRIPDQIKNVSAENFRFKLKRYKSANHGQISVTNFNNYKIGKVDKEEIERINKIIREEVMAKKK